MENEVSTNAITQARKRANTKEERGPGAQLRTGLAQCCHLLSPHIPEGTKAHSGAAAQASWLSGGHFTVTALGLELPASKFPLGQEEQCFKGLRQEPQRQEISSNIYRPIPSHPLQKEFSQNTSSDRVEYHINIYFSLVY